MGIARPHVCLRRAIAFSLEKCLSCRADLRQFAWLMLYLSMVGSVLQLCGAGPLPLVATKIISCSVAGAAAGALEYFYTDRPTLRPDIADYLNPYI